MKVSIHTYCAVVKAGGMPLKHFLEVLCFFKKCCIFNVVIKTLSDLFREDGTYQKDRDFSLLIVLIVEVSRDTSFV